MWVGSRWITIEEWYASMGIDDEFTISSDALWAEDEGRKGGDKKGEDKKGSKGEDKKGNDNTDGKDKAAKKGKGKGDEGNDDKEGNPWASEILAKKSRLSK